VVGALGLFGLSLLLAGARRTSRRGSAARRGLRESRRETAAVSQDRDDLISQREAARAHTSTLGNGAAGGGRHVGEDGGRPRSVWHPLGRQPASPQAATPPAHTASGQAASDTPAGDLPADAPAAAE
jgi:hypothetical protein